MSKEVNLSAMLLTSPEAAQMLSISERSLWTLMKSGSIPHVRIGRSVRYDRDDLKAWIEKQKQNKHSKIQGEAK